MAKVGADLHLGAEGDLIGEIERGIRTLGGHSGVELLEASFDLLEPKEKSLVGRGHRGLRRDRRPSE
jgi:hypothetical protein